MGDEHVGKRACAHGLGKAFAACGVVGERTVRASRTLRSPHGAVRVGPGDDGVRDSRGRISK